MSSNSNDLPLLNGMTVIFSKAVPVSPVTLIPKK